MKPNPKTIFITGGASGIGLETARYFAGLGWQVGVADRNGARAAEVATELGAEVSAYEIDVSDPASLRRALADFAETRGAIRVVFNSAGVLEMRPFAETPLERLHAIADINFIGVINSIYEALPFVKRSGDGRIVTMCSISAIYGIPDLAVYSATKFAIRGLTEALNIEFEPLGVWVSDILVAYVATPMVNAADSRAKSVDLLGVNVAPRQVAATVWKAVEERRVHWFVTDADEAVATQVDGTPWEARKDLVKGFSGY